MIATVKASLNDIEDFTIFLNPEIKVVLRKIPSEKTIDMRFLIEGGANEKVATLDISLLCSIYLKPILRDWSSVEKLPDPTCTNDYPRIIQNQEQIQDVDALIIQFDEENHVQIELTRGICQLKLNPCCLDSLGNLSTEKFTQLSLTPAASNVILLSAKVCTF